MITLLMLLGIGLVLGLVVGFVVDVFKGHYSGSGPITEYKQPPLGTYHNIRSARKYFSDKNNYIA